jgi:iron(III) transport system permease protein
LPLLAGAPAALIITICCLMPLAWMVGAIVANPVVRTELKMTRFRAALLGRTLGYNGTAAVIATLMGLPAGFVLGRGRGWLAKVLWLLLPAALLMPSLSYAYGWSQFVRLTRPAFRPLGVTFIPGGTADTLRCIWSLAAWLWAVPAGLVGLALRRLDTNVQQHAVLDGALHRVTLRQLAGPIIASLAIVTVLATQEFAVYEPTGISVVATEVRMVFDTGAMSTPDMPITVSGYLSGGKMSPDQAGRAAAAVATALPLLGITILLAIVAAWGAGRTSAVEALSVGPWPRVLNAPLWASIVAVALVILNIGVPVWALVESLRIPFSVVNMWNEFGPQVQGAIIVAVIASVVACIAAFSAAARWTPGLIALGGASFLVGGQLLAIALIRIYNRPWLDWAYNAFPVPVIAYVGRFGWLALAGGRGTWSKPWRELRDMAAVDGAGAVRTAWSVVWPLAWPSLAAGGLLVGALSLTEVPATVLLFPQNPQVLTPTLMTWVHMARFDPMIEASLLMMMAVLVPAIAALTLVTIGLRMSSRKGWVGK